MKIRVLFMAIAWISVFTGRAETFVGITSATNRLLVATNEAIVFNKLSAQSNATSTSKFIVWMGTSYSLLPPISSQSPPGAFAGPCELVFTNAHVVSFLRLTNTPIQMAVLPTATPATTQTLVVPTNQTLHFFVSSGYGRADVQRGGELVTDVEMRGGEELDGPLTVVLKGVTGTTQPDTTNTASIFSYYLTESATVVPQAGVLQGPTGGFQLAVEKSVNLSNWFPTVLQSLNSDQKAFYRLRIAK